MRVSQGSRHLLASAGIVLVAPVGMAAASIEGSPLRDAVRAPLEKIGIVAAEETRDGAMPGSGHAPADGGRAGETQSSAADPSSADAGATEAARTPAAAPTRDADPAAEPAPAATAGPDAPTAPDVSPEPTAPLEDAPAEPAEPPPPETTGEGPVDDLLSRVPELLEEIP